MDALVDSGSEATLMSDRLWKSTVKKDKGQCPPLVGVDGTELDVLGQGEEEIQIGKNQLVRHRYYVVKNMPYDIILGTDFLERNKAVVDLGERKVVINGETIRYSRGQYVALVRETKRLSPEWEVRVACNTTIPPHSRKIVFGWTREEFIEEGETIIENVETDRDGCYVEPALLGRNLNRRKFPLVMVNESEQPYKLVANVLIGRLETGGRILTKNTKETCVMIANLRIKEVGDKGLESKGNQESEKRQCNLDEILEPRKGEVGKLIEEYEDIFSKGENDLGRTALVTHEINTQGSDPVYQRAYRVPYASQGELDRQLDSMLKNDLVEEANSPWAAPVLIIDKKDGTKRLVVDFRRLNRVTRKDRYPIPNITETLDSLGKAKFFTTLDLAAGYWQVEVKEEDRDKTAFTTARGQFRFKVLPFGLCNAPSTFQRIMDQTLRGLLHKNCLVYLDDIIIYSETFEDHLVHLRQVFERLRKANLKLKPGKCYIGRRQVKYLGHIVSEAGVKPDPENVNKVLQFMEPTDKKSLKSFLGMLGYYRKFVPGYSELAHPLIKLTHEKQSFEWGQEQNKNLKILKKLLSEEPILKYPDFDKEFILATDASNVAIGAVLGQLDELGKEHPVAYASRVLNKAERNYSTTEREALAIFWAVKHFHAYLHNVHFRIITDHQALRWLKSAGDSVPKLMRWSMKINSYDFDIFYKNGKKHANADAMSRLESVEVNALGWKEETPEAEERRFRFMQKQDKFCVPILRQIRDKGFKELQDGFLVENGLLYHR